MTASFDSSRVQCLGYRKEQSAARNAHLSSVDKVTACCDDAGGSPSWGTCHRCPCQGDNTRQSQLLSTSTAADRGPKDPCLCCRLACLFTKRYVPVNLKNSCQAIALFTAPFILYTCPRYSVHTSEVSCVWIVCTFNSSPNDRPPSWCPVNQKQQQNACHIIWSFK